jgi:hypothetical protein
MDFASRRWCALALAGLAFLTGPACRRGGPEHARSEAPPPAATFALSGRVADEADRAVPEARVLAFGSPGDAAATSRRETRTDLGGRFDFEGLPRGRYTLLVEAVGLASIEPPAVEVPGSAPVIRLSGQGRSLSGTVVGAGTPMAGARVRLGGDGGTLARVTVSDDAGRFVFHGLGPGGTYALRATKGLLASAIAVDVPTDDAPDAGRRRAVALELGAGLGVEGLVVDDGGRALAGAEVRAESTLLPDDPLADAVTSKPDGHFRLGPLPPGRFRLVARAPGTLLRAPASVALVSGAAVPAQRLELVRAASLEGRLADARGAPIAGALIRCGGGGAALTDLTVIFDALPLAAEAAALGGGARRELGATKVTRSDVTGAFRLDDLLPGPVRLAVTRAPSTALETELPSLAPGEHRALGVLTLGDAAAADAGVAAPPSTPAAPADATLVGVARDSGGRPLARARVRAWARGAGDTALAVAPTAAALASTVTDAGGHFTLGHVPRAPLWVEVDHPAYPPTFVETTAGGPVELTAPIPGGVDGDVREHVTGAGVPRATVEGVGPNGQRASVTARKASASFRLTRLAPGPWTLTARAPGYVATVRDVEVPPSPILGETSVRSFRLELDLAR